MLIKILEKIFGIFSATIIIGGLVLVLFGFQELINNQSLGVIAFYGFLTILLGLRVIDFLEFPLELIFGRRSLGEDEE